MTTLTLYQTVHTQESPARVGHWWRTYLLLMQLFPWKFLLGRGPGLTLECTWSFALR